MAQHPFRDHEAAEHDQHRDPDQDLAGCVHGSLRLVKQRFGTFPGVAPGLRITAIHPDALGGFSALSRLFCLENCHWIPVHVGWEGSRAHGGGKRESPQGESCGLKEFRGEFAHRIGQSGLSPYRQRRVCLRAKRYYTD